MSDIPHSFSEIKLQRNGGKMMVKKVLAVFLVALMAMTAVSAAGLLAAPKAAARTTSIAVPIWYKPGKTYVFSPWQYNVHQAYGNSPKHCEYSKGATALASITGTGTEDRERVEADVGMRLQLKGITTDQLAGKMCKITITERYKLDVQGDSAGVFLGTRLQTGVYYTILKEEKVRLQSDTQYVKIATRTFTHTVPLKDIFGPDAENNLYGIVSAYTESSIIISSDVPQHATTTATVYYIAVSFPPS